MKGRVLIVAGSDSGGGAGIQADIKTVTALGGYAMTAITALTAQNTLGVEAIHDVPAHFVAHQMHVVLDDIGADCIKIGMLNRSDVIEAVVDVLDAMAQGIPVVVDPVMIAKSGHALLAEDAAESLILRLLPRARLLTPNIPEAEVLTGLTIRTVEDMRAAGAKLMTLGPAMVLLKGGHLPGERLTDLLFMGSEEVAFEDSRIDTRHTHGTGCTLASAVATGLAQGLEPVDAVTRARAYVREAIRTAPGLGEGHGPLNHGHPVSKSR